MSHFKFLAVLLVVMSTVVGAQASEQAADPRVVACEWTTQELESIEQRAGENFSSLLDFRVHLESVEISQIAELRSLVSVSRAYAADLGRWQEKVSRVLGALNWECSDYPLRKITAQSAATLIAGFEATRLEITLLIQDYSEEILHHGHR